MSRLTTIVFMFAFVLICYCLFIAKTAQDASDSSAQRAALAATKVDELENRIGALDQEITTLKQQAALPTSPLQTSTASEPPTQRPQTTSTRSIYKVKRGENLWDISQKLYRTHWHWDKLWQMNKNTLPNYRKMPAGFRLKLPPDLKLADL
ncbi:MAG: LysM peptidoglycan-binding domain-containing protein [Elusimicrobiota bacterium]